MVRLGFGLTLPDILEFLYFKICNPIKFGLIFRYGLPVQFGTFGRCVNLFCGTCTSLQVRYGPYSTGHGTGRKIGAVYTALRRC